MKRPLHINEELLRQIMQVTGIRSRAKAVDLALREFVRRHETREAFTAGLGLTAAELRRAYDPASLAVQPPPARLAAESASPYAKTDPAGH